MIKMGLEKEFFVCDKDGNPIVCPDEIPADSCGVLAEARGKPFDNITEAVFSLRADVHRLCGIASELGVLLVPVPTMKISRDIRIEASRKYAKGLTKCQNIYGHTKHKHKVSEMTAGIHISFTVPNIIYSKDGEKVTTVNKVWDFVTLFRQFDAKFKKEISESRRRPGFYEVKEDGRIEYRSLPTNINSLTIIDVVKEVLNEQG